jgi:hypothetical protein
MTHRLRPEHVMLGLLPLLTLAIESCAGGPHASTVATGSVRCANVTGTVDFSPALSVSGKAPETVTVSARLAQCSAMGSNDARVSGGLATLTIPVPTNACSGLLQFPSAIGNVASPSSSRTISVDTTWSPPGITPSVMTFSGFVVTTDASGDAGFAFPGTGHSAKVQGSFAGKDSGALSTASVFANEGASQILSSCSHLSGLTSIPIVSGEVTFG